jgi:hypothetical protein
MKLYVTDIEYAKAHEAELRSLRMKGNMIVMYSDHNRQALMRLYRTLANFYIADDGEFAFSGCYILFNERSENTEKVIEILNENHVRFRFAYPYTNACGGQDVKYETDASLSNDLYTYVLSFDSKEQKKTVKERLALYCEVIDDEHGCHLVFRESNPYKALNAILAHEKIDPSQVVYLNQ